MLSSTKLNCASSSPKTSYKPKPGLPTNYNVAPTQRNPVITGRDPDKLQLFRWGLVPFWAKDLKIGARMINARREGIEDKASFRKPIREKRCLVIGDSPSTNGNAKTARSIPTASNPPTAACS